MSPKRGGDAPTICGAFSLLVWVGNGRFDELYSYNSTMITQPTDNFIRLLSGPMNWSHRVHGRERMFLLWRSDASQAILFGFHGSESLNRDFQHGEVRFPGG